jgi:ABC-type polysaccharide/polyol phosphate transport system ATPase subunit
VSEYSIEIRDLSKQFRLRHERQVSLKRMVLRLFRPYPTDVMWALQGLSLQIRRGETVGIIGSNGSGKSTLLRVLAGVYPPTSGEVHVYGRTGGLYELGVGFHPELSGVDNVRLAGALMGHTPGAVREKMPDIEEFCELGDFLTVPVKAYSSGMALRLGFAIAINFAPDILLVDEILAAGDAHFQHRAYQRLRKLQADGSTLVMVSHEMSALRTMCSRIVWLERGQLVRDGAVDEVIDAYLEQAQREAG